MGKTKRIKILFFIETLTGGGAEKVLCNLVNHMDQTLFDITVQTVWPCDARSLLFPGIHYKSMFPSKSKTNLLRYRFEAESGLAYRLHIKDDYDIECAYLEMGATKILASSTNSKAKKLAWVHCDIAKAISDPSAYVKKASPCYAKYDRVICVSRQVKENFDKLFHDQFQTTVIYNVIDDKSIRRKSQEQIPEGKPRKRKITILSVGRFSSPKNYMRLLRTHKQLLGEGIDHDLWILGDGAEREKLEQYVSENGLEDSVWMPGFIQNPYPFMREADILVCSSNYEGYSTFMTEAVILEKPIVTTDVSGMRELLGDSEYGLITKNEDKDFYLGLKRLLQDPSLQTHYASKAFERSQDFCADRLTRTTEEFFLNLVQT